MKVVLQDGAKDCGVASLLSIIRYYGGEISKEYLRELTGTRKSGVSLYKLLESAEKLGFSCEGVKGDILSLDINKLPCIAHIVEHKKYQHFIVVYKIDFSKEIILVMDPARGKRNLSFSEFRLLSSNYFLYLLPVKKLPVFQERKPLACFVKHFCYSYHFLFGLVVLLSIIFILCQLVTAFHFQYLYDFAVVNSVTQLLLSFSLCLLSFYFFQVLFSFLKDFLLTKLSLLFEEELIYYVYKQILLLPYFFFKNRTLGEILERIKDIIKIKNFLIQFFSSLLTEFLFLLMFFFLLFMIHYLLFSFVLGYFLIMFIISLLSFKRKVRYQKQVLNKSDYIQTLFIESFQNVDTMKGLHLEYDFLEQFKNSYQLYLNKVYDFQKWMLLEEMIKQIFYYGVLLLFYGFTAYFILKQKLSIAQIFISQYIFHTLLGYMMRWLSFIFEGYQIPVAIARIRDLFNLFRENFDGGNYYQLMVITGDISFSNLNFSYGLQKLFSNFSFTFFAHKKTLLTGESGGGKSSLVKMIMRYIEIPYGVLKIGNVDINHYHLELLRGRVSYLTGSELLFSNTLYYNITLGREVDSFLVEKVAKLVLLDSLVLKHPLRYQMMVEENGFNFSGGERQKILLARALLKNSDIYIFDEAFHQIDTSQEAIILKNIFDYLKEKTIIVISHRLQHLELYDYRYKLEGGKIYEI